VVGVGGGVKGDKGGEGGKHVEDGEGSKRFEGSSEVLVLWLEFPY